MEQQLLRCRILAQFQQQWYHRNIGITYWLKSEGNSQCLHWRGTQKNAIMPQLAGDLKGELRLFDLPRTSQREPTALRRPSYWIRRWERKKGNRREWRKESMSEGRWARVSLHLIRPHHYAKHIMQPTVNNVPSRCVCLSAGHNCELYNHGWADWGAIWGMDSGGNKEPCIRQRPWSPGRAIFFGGASYVQL